MKSINLGKKRVVEIQLNDLECVATLDNYAIDHFQSEHGVGFLQAVQDLQDMKITSIINLLGSLIREKNTNRPVGAEYLHQFDTMEVITALMPLLTELIPGNLPDAKEDKEKK